MAEQDVRASNVEELLRDADINSGIISRHVTRLKQSLKSFRDVEMAVAMLCPVHFKQLRIELAKLVVAEREASGISAGEHNCRVVLSVADTLGDDC